MTRTGLTASAVLRSARIPGLLALVALVGLVSPNRALAQQPGQPSSPPPIVVEPPLRDFGLVKPASVHPTEFVLRNTGSVPVRIAAALPSCKCTTIENLAGTEIPAGGSITLPASMEAPSSPGEKTARIMMAFTGYSGVVMANLRCEVEMPVEVVEEFVDALKGTTGGTVTVRSRDGKPFRILSSNGEAPAFIGFDPASDEPRAEYQVAWSVNGWPCTGMRLWWIFETDRADCPILPARIRHECTGSRADPGRAQRKWIFHEQIVNAESIKPGGSARVKLAIENAEPKATRGAALDQGFRTVTGVRSMHPDVQATLVKVTPRGLDQTEIEVDLKVSPGFTGMLYAPIMVTTSTGEHDVAVVASVR